MANYIGQSVKRVEDRRFITGKGRYTDDITLPGMTFAAIVRSPHAHATSPASIAPARGLPMAWWRCSWARIWLLTASADCRAAGRWTSRTAIP